MSEWFKEHDWKSCDWEDWSGGSNPLLCANEKHTLLWVCFSLRRREELEGDSAFAEGARSVYAIDNVKSYYIGVFFCLIILQF